MPVSCLFKAVCSGKTQIVTTRTRAFPAPHADPARSGTPTKVEPVLAEGEIATRVVEYAEAGGGVSVSDAAVIVSGGRGVSNNPALTPPGGLDEKAS